MEINEKYKLINRKHLIIDLGAAPGGEIEYLLAEIVNQYKSCATCRLVFGLR